MILWIKLFIIIWVYLFIGSGVTIIGQVLAHSVEKMDDYYDWYISFKLDTNDDDFGINFFLYIILWPFVLVGCLIMLVEVGLKKLLKIGKK